MISMKEQHTGGRIQIELPVEISWRGPTGNTRQAKGKTSNISGSGLFIETPLRLPRATCIMFTVQLPREATKVPLELACEGRVIRGSQRGQPLGIGVVIDEYELLPVPGIRSKGRRSLDGK